MMDEHARSILIDQITGKQIVYICDIKNQATLYRIQKAYIRNQIQKHSN